jgi:hypothetical protein
MVGGVGERGNIKLRRVRMPSKIVLLPNITWEFLIYKVNFKEDFKDLNNAHEMYTSVPDKGNLI